VIDSPVFSIQTDNDVTSGGATLSAMTLRSVGTGSTTDAARGKKERKMGQ